MKGKRSGLSVVMAFVLAGPALAQGLPTPTQRDYARELGARLERPVGHVAHVMPETFWLDRTTQPPTPMMADGGTGVQVTMGDLSVTRLEFPTPADAQRHLHAVQDGMMRGFEPPVAMELRGDQLLVVQGPAAADPAALRTITDQAWAAPGMPPAPDVADTSMVQLDGKTFAVTSRLREGPMFEAILRGLATARAVADEDERVKMLGDDVMLATFPGGLRTSMGDIDGMVAAVTAGDEAAWRRVVPHLSAQEKAVRGNQRDALEDIGAAMSPSGPAPHLDPHTGMPVPQETPGHVRTLDELFR